MSTEADPERNAPSSNGPPPPKLAKYRLMTGIAAPSDVILNDLKRPGPNIGIYARVINEEKKAQRSYLLVSTVISLSFLGQIIVAATLTALGASNASHIAITVLGSVNTVIAGIQTYLKGQGLPNRVRQYQFGLRKLREYMEDRERDFSDKDCKLNVDHIVEDVAAMYSAVRQTAEDNTPENYLPMEGAAKKLRGQKDASLKVPELLMGEDEHATVEQDKGKGLTDDHVGGDHAETQPNQEDDREESPLLKDGQERQ